MRRTLTLVSLIALTALVAGVTGAWASHEFWDVPTSSPFHGDISELAGAGITTGHADGGFHPNEKVTRASMAGFLGRGLSRVQQASFDWTGIPTSSWSQLTFLENLEQPSAGGYGPMLVRGTVTVSYVGTTCPCTIGIWVGREGSSSSVHYETVPYANAQTVYGSASVEFMEMVPGGSEDTYWLRASNLSPSAIASVQGTLTVAYAPFLLF